MIFTLTHSALWVGAATAAQFLPGLIGSPIGGHLADNYDRRRLLILFLSIMGLGAVGLWLVIAAGTESVLLILALVSVMGFVWGMTLPAWQAFVNDLVPRKALVSAVSLNSLQFNGARSIGPAIAGIVIATIGPAGAFALNALSFVIVIIAFSFVRSTSHVADSAHMATKLIAGFKESVRYIPRQPGIMLVIVVVSLTGLLGTPIFGFTIVFAGSVYEVGALQMGLLNAALGLGAVLAVPAVVRAKSHGGLSSGIRMGVLVMSLSIIGFSVAPNLWTGAITLIAAGFGFLLTISAGNTVVQLIVAGRIRARVMALRLMAYMVFTTIGALIFGAVSDHLGPRVSMSIAGTLLLLVAGSLFTARGKRALVRADDPHDSTY